MFNKFLPRSFYFLLLPRTNY